MAISKIVGTEKVSIKDWAKVLGILSGLKNPPRRTLLHGLPGTGKTTYALSLSPESERITLTQGQFPDALLGKFLLKDGSTFWANAPATRAAIRGIPLVLDEIHKAGSELDSTLQAVLDDEAVCRLNLDNGETITPAQGYRIIATMNGSPDQLADAVLDRFDIVLKCNTPHEGILRRLSPEAAKFILNKMQNEPDNDEWTPAITPRRMLAFDHLRNEGVSDELAAELVFGEGQGKTVLMAMIDATRNTETV
jgi:MoxR-like ATPase